MKLPLANFDLLSLIVKLLSIKVGTYSTDFLKL